MKIEQILLNGELLGEFTAGDGVRFVYELNGAFAR